MYPIKKVSKVDSVFGVYNLLSSGLIPEMQNVPEEFRDGSNPWCSVARHWIYDGLNRNTEIYTKENVDIELAINHLKSILNSEELEIEEKIIYCSFLMNEWFIGIDIPKEEVD